MARNSSSPLHEARENSGVALGVDGRVGIALEHVNDIVGDHLAAFPVFETGVIDVMDALTQLERVGELIVRERRHLGQQARHQLIRTVEVVIVDELVVEVLDELARCRVELTRRVEALVRAGTEVVENDELLGLLAVRSDLAFRVHRRGTVSIFGRRLTGEKAGDGQQRDPAQRTNGESGLQRAPPMGVCTDELSSNGHRADRRTGCIATDERDIQ